MAEDQTKAPALTRLSGTQLLSDDVGLDKDSSLNQALNDSKEYESFMRELKQVHRKECEQEREQAHEDSEEESPLAVEEDLESVPKNKVVSHLVQQVCNLVLRWRNTSQPQQQLSESQRQ